VKRRERKRNEWGPSATYILEGFLVPESLVLLDLVLEELGYPEKEEQFRSRSGASRRGK